MDLQLRGKRAFVSGSSTGIGMATALELAAEGCDVIVQGRDKARTEEAAHKVAQRRVKSAAFTCDLAMEDETNRMCDGALTTFGSIDILVNNCGVALHQDNVPWDELTSEDYINSFQVHFISAIRLARRFVPGMKANTWGRLVNVSSSTGAQVMGILVDYSSSKAALNKLTADMSKNLGHFGITVNATVPGAIVTPAIERHMTILKSQHGWGDDPEENERRYVALNPQSVPRLGKPRDPATLITFLASPLSGYINGALIRIDGGMAQSM
jgi:NAD(P)-dependent dehydrogenase (short-subunit alcohol dehydrogenase family)